MNRLQQLADIRNKIYRVTEKLAIEIELHLEATKVDTQAIYALSEISDTYAKLVMTEEKLEQEIEKREAIALEKIAAEDTPPDEEISATDKVILELFKNSPRFRNLKEAQNAKPECTINYMRVRASNAYTPCT